MDTLVDTCLALEYYETHAMGEEFEEKYPKCYNDNNVSQLLTNPIKKEPLSATPLQTS